MQKERDLELAAKIGQTLLEKNKFFEDKNEELEQALSQANEKLSQLKHDLSMKEELLKIYTQNYEIGDLSSPDTPGAGGAHVPSLEKKIKSLEDENLDLHMETSKLKLMTQELEDKEQKLVNDCIQQLGMALFLYSSKFFCQYLKFTYLMNRWHILFDLVCSSEC